MNRQVFSTQPKPTPHDTRNEAGGLAYTRSPKEALQQYAMTGCFNGTFYVSAEDHLQRTLELCRQVSDPETISGIAIEARERGLMKDMPVFLLAYLAVNDGGTNAFIRAFPRVIDNVKQLSKFIHVMRSGVLGRKAVASNRIKKTIIDWLAKQTPADLWWQSVGVADPSMVDILRLVHPKPATPQHAALFGYLSGRNPKGMAVKTRDLPDNLKSWLKYQKKPSGELPKVPFQLLVGLENADWEIIARNATWAQIRQSLNTFGRHDVFKKPALVAELAKKLAVPPERMMPYQIMTTYQNIEKDTPRPLVDALHDAMEAACRNVPVLPENTLVAVDVSGSMSNASVTGFRQGSTSKTRCIDVAALMASAFLRTSRGIDVIAFDTGVHDPELEPRDSILTNAAKLAKYGGGGTNCSLAIEYGLKKDAKYDTILVISDNESWAGMDGGMATLWARYQRQNKKAKVICLDLTPNRTSQIRSDDRRQWNIGGFSDMVFEVVARIAA